MKKTVLLLFVLLTSSLFAQNYVTIPDANFAKWLQDTIPSAMNGNQLDTSSALVKNLSSMDLEAKAIKNLEGVQYFTGLLILDVGNSYLTLEKDKNKFSTLPTLPKNLFQLTCGNVGLDSLPELPNGIGWIKCYGNNLKFLPSLPDSLVELYCDNNKLTELPELPKKLRILDCFSNELKSLPNLPSTLERLWCLINKLQSLPILPNSLLELRCGANFLSDLPTLPNKLTNLETFNNKLTSLPELPNSLLTLDIDHNNITNLQKLPINLKLLDCSENQIISLPILYDSLIILDCSENKITDLPILPVNLKKLYCDNNNIHCLPILPKTLTDSALFYGFYIELGDRGLSLSNNPFKCLPNYVSVMDSATLAMPLCSENDTINNPFNCSNSKFGILGTANLDVNKNCQKDVQETGISNLPIALYDKENNLISTTYSSLNGVYQFPVGTNSYHVKLDSTNLPFNVLCKNGIDTSITLTDTNIFAKDVNFNLTAKDGFDVCVRSITAYGAVFPGQTHALVVAAGDITSWYNQHCATGISGELQLTITGPISYVGTTDLAKKPTINGNTYTYTISDFGKVDFKNDFGLLFDTDTTAKAGDQICVHAQITPKEGDYKPENNTYDFCYSVINSHDPNLKEVYPANFKPGYDGYLTYTVHFQNTGNAPAYNIRLVDTLDAKLDLKTFEVLNYSHANTVTLTGNVMTVKYKNILLSDSTTNEKASHGFIQYHIKPLAPISEEHQIKNTAYIYFDYNEAVVTNTTISKANKSLGILEEKEIGLRVYPNPTENVLTFERTSHTINNVRVSILSVNGQELFTKTLDLTNKQTVDLTDYAPGVYFVNLQNEEASEVIKVVKK